MPVKGDARTLFDEYFDQVQKIWNTGSFTEMTFRTALENLLRKVSTVLNPIQEPSRKGGIGAPDFRVYKGAVKIGYVETKELSDYLDS